MAHLEPMFFTGVFDAGFVGGLSARKENHLVEAECIHGGFGDMDMTEVDGIKGAAKQADVQGAGLPSLSCLI